MEQILFITSNLGYWGKLEEHNSIQLFIESHIGTFDSDRSKILNISKDNYIPTEGDKIYFMPEVNIPRVKFKNLALEKKIRSVRDVENANIIFANQATLYRITTTKSNHVVSTERFKELLNESWFTDKLDSKYKNALTTALEFYTHEKIFVDRTLANACTIKKDFSESMDYDTMLIIGSDYTDAVEQCKDKLIFDEGGVVDLLNGEAASVIDADMFKQLSTMFDSSDTDNHILAMEIMANCKYNASLAHMLLLFKDYSHKMMNCHTRNHVNFKSLTGWIGKDILNRNSLDTLCQILEEKGQFTPDKLDILLNHSHVDILHRGESKYFTIKVITLNPDHTIPGYDYKVVPEVEENFDEAIENAIDLIEPIEAVEDVVEEESLSESELNNPEEESEIIEVTTEDVVLNDIEVILPVETVLINQKIEKNESDDFEWF